MNELTLTPKLQAVFNKAVVAIRELSEAFNELMENLKENFTNYLEELVDCIEIPERETYKPCLKIGFTKAPQTPVKLWRKNRALFRPCKGVQFPNQSVKEVLV